MIYENKRQRARFGSPSYERREAVSGGQRASRSGAHRGSVPRSGGEMEASSGERRAGRFEIQAASRAETEIRQTAEETFRENSSGRSGKSRLPNRTLDVSSSGRTDMGTVWSEISPRSCLEDTRFDGLELPKTGKALQRKGRGGHHSMAKKGMAAYKKKPANLATALYLLMKAGLCFIHPAYARGLLVVKLLFNTHGIGTIAFRPYRRLLLHRKEKGSTCIFGFKEAISNSIRCLNSRLTSDCIFAGALYLYLIDIMCIERRCACS